MPNTPSTPADGWHNPVASSNAKPASLTQVIGELRIEAFAPRLAAGFALNRAANCIRITHVPTGIKAESSSERGQHANRQKALDMLVELLPEVYKRTEPAADGFLPDGSRVEHKTMAHGQPEYLSSEVGAAHQRQRIENFNREWALIPCELQRRIKELARFPNDRNQNYLSGVIRGYSLAKPSFNDGYAGVLVLVLAGKDRDLELVQEVLNAQLSI